MSLRNFLRATQKLTAEAAEVYHEQGAKALREGLLSLGEELVHDARGNLAGRVLTVAKWVAPHAVVDVVSSDGRRVALGTCMSSLDLISLHNQVTPEVKKVESMIDNFFAQLIGDDPDIESVLAGTDPSRN